MGTSVYREWKTNCADPYYSLKCVRPGQYDAANRHHSKC